jgi:hypothetical protein
MSIAVRNLPWDHTIQIRCSLGCERERRAQLTILMVKVEPGRAIPLCAVFDRYLFVSSYKQQAASPIQFGWITT